MCIVFFFKQKTAYEMRISDWSSDVCSSESEAVEEAHAAFVPLNTRFLEAITRWQIRPVPWDAMASNDHSDWRWDEQVLGNLTSLARRLRPIEDRLAERKSVV